MRKFWVKWQEVGKRHVSALSDRATTNVKKQSSKIRHDGLFHLDQMVLRKHALTGGTLHSLYFWMAVFGMGISDLIRSGGALTSMQAEKKLRKLDEFRLEKLEEVRSLLEDKHEEGTEMSKIFQRFAKYKSIIGRKLHTTNPLDLMEGAEQVARIHEQYRWFREGVVRKRTIPKDELYHLDRLMRFSAASYGWKTLHFLGLGKRGMYSNRKGIEMLTGVHTEDILLLEDESKLYRPGHFVVVDHVAKSVNVVIRGTFRVQDLLTDLICDDVPFTVHDKDSKVEGRVHEGFLRASQALAVDLHDIVKDALEKHPGYELHTAGHSLGGSVASLLALIWGHVPLFRERNVKAFSFASPCCFSQNLGRSDFARKHITSIIVGDDFISRLSLVSVEHLARGCDILARKKDLLSNHEKRLVLEELRKETRMDRMVPGGTCYHIPLRWRFTKPDSFDVHFAEEVDPSVSMGEIIITPKMFDIHLPIHYINALRSQLQFQKCT